MNEIYLNRKSNDKTLGAIAFFLTLNLSLLVVLMISASEGPLYILSIGPGSSFEGQCPVTEIGLIKSVNGAVNRLNVEPHMPPGLCMAFVKSSRCMTSPLAGHNTAPFFYP